MNNLVGYKIWGKGEPVGDIGLAYDYILAGDGLWVRTDGEHLSAIAPVAPAHVRGLPPLGQGLQLKYGLIPQRFWDLALSVFLASSEVEKYVGIRWDGKGYALHVPPQEGGSAIVKYLTAADTVVELHSHPGMGPAFSSIDDADEQGLKIYGVVGLPHIDEERIGHQMSVSLRVGVYGYWAPVRWGEVFNGELQGVIDVNGKEEARG